MKTLITFVLVTTGALAHADFRKIHLDGEDAAFIEHVFRDVSRRDSVPNPLTAQSLLDLTVFSSKALHVSCKTRYVFYSERYSCDVEVDPSKATPGFLVKRETERVIRVEVSDPALVGKMNNYMGSRTFESLARAADGLTPLLRMNCDGGVCTLWLAN